MELSLILKDDTNHVTLKVDRSKLLTIPFFQTIFIPGTEESSKNEIDINVPYLNAAIHLITGINKLEHSDPDWKLELEICLCKDYFFMDNNLSFLNDLKVPLEGLELLKRTMEIIGIRVETVQAFINNFQDFPLEIFSRDF